MAFTDLSIELQNIMLEQYYFLSKSILLLVLFAFALIYLFYWIENKQKPTILYSKMVVRLILTVVSGASIGLFPFFIFMLSPTYSFWDFMDMYLSIYGAVFLIGLFVFAYLDFYYYGFGVAGKLLGIDMNHPRISKAYKTLFKNKKLRMLDVPKNK